MTDDDTGGTLDGWDDEADGWTEARECDCGVCTTFAIDLPSRKYNPICPTCRGDGWVTNGTPSPDSPPGSRTWCQTCYGRGVFDPSMRYEFAEPDNSSHFAPPPPVWTRPVEPMDEAS